jgi:hypothetical protein
MGTIVVFNWKLPGEGSDAREPMFKEERKCRVYK